MHVPAQHRVFWPILLLVTTGLVWAAQPSVGEVVGDGAVAAEVPPVLAGEKWLRHHREDLLPYWDMPAAYGDPVGNYPSERGTDGELLPDSTNRVTSTLGRGVYGYSVSFMLTGDERYLTLARAGLDWIEAHAADPVNGGYYGELDAAGDPVDAEANKDLFDLATVGMGYAAYFNATRDPDAEAKLLAIRDLIFTTYYDAASNSLHDSMTYDLAEPFDTGDNGGDITNALVPGTGIFLPTLSLLSDADRRAQFRSDLRTLTDLLITRHRNNAAGPNQRWMFWGRTDRIGSFNAAQTDFGHNLKSYAMVHNANQVFADRPWDGLATDRTAMLTRAWDPVETRWNLRPRGFGLTNVEPDSGWWPHDEGDQLLAALDLTSGFGHAEQLALSAQKFLDIYVDDDSPARETFTRVVRAGSTDTDIDLRKSFPGKNMDHNFEHALVLYLHGQQMAGLPARLHYAFPGDQALTAEARPYWFDATGQSRIDVRPSNVLPGHRLVTVDFTGIGQVPRPPHPAPADATAPVTSATVTPAPSPAGWHADDVTVSLTATDDQVGVKEVHVQVEDASGATPGTASIRPGAEVTLPTFTGEGEWQVTYFAVDALGNAEPRQQVTVRIDRTAPAVAGLPEQPCVLWPPNRRLVRIADVSGTDDRSGVDAVAVQVSVNQAVHRDVVILGGRVWVRAERDGGRDRVYTVHGTVTDLAGNATTESDSCVVPQRP